jgi:hypothetical protein
MRAAGLRGCVRGKKRRTTRRDPRAAPAADLLRRDFVAALSPKQGLAGGHNLHTDGGGLSLPGLLILDTHSRRIVGWSMDSHMRTESLWSTPWRWRYGDASRRRDSSCIIPIAAFSTQRSRSASALRGGRHRSLDGKDRDCPGQRDGRELHRHPQERTCASAPLSRPGSSKERHLRVPGRVLQPTQTTFGFESYRSPVDYEEATMEGVAVA